MSFAAPEQLDSVATDPDTLTDISQLSAVGYAAFTGRPPSNLAVENTASSQEGPYVFSSLEQRFGGYDR